MMLWNMLSCFLLPLLYMIHYQYGPKNFFWKKIFFSKKIFFFQKIFKNFRKFWKFLKNCHLKMQKKSIFRENWWVTKTTWGHFLPSPKPPGGQNPKRPPPYNISDPKHQLFRRQIYRQPFSIPPLLQLSS